MKRETRIAILKDLYQESAGISDADLYEEAIVTLESYFDSIDPETLYHRKRVSVIAYLALLNERECLTSNLSSDDYCSRGVRREE